MRILFWLPLAAETHFVLAPAAGVIFGRCADSGLILQSRTRFRSRQKGEGFVPAKNSDDERNEATTTKKQQQPIADEQRTSEANIDGRWRRRH